MNYCSIEDAFQLSPGCNTNGQDYSAKEARREERRKAKRCKGPAATYLGVQEDKDPDRQHLERPKEVQAMNNATGLKAHVPLTAPLGMEPFQDMYGVVTPQGDDNEIDDGIRRELAQQRVSEFLPRTDGDPIGDKQRSTLPTPSMLVQAVSSTGSTNKKKNFFGADPDDDSFADYIPDAKNFLMQPSFEDAFKSINPGYSSSTPALQVPSVRDVWKPLLPSGVDTAFVNKLPPPGGQYMPQVKMDREETYLSMSQKVDRILARLDNMQKVAKPEQSQKEIMMFVASGVFVLFMMDLLVRKGSTLRLR